MKSKFIILVILLILNTSQLVKAQNYPVTYQLKNYYSTSSAIRVEVVTQHLGAFILEKSRWWTRDRRPTKEVFCADDNRLIPYDTPQICSMIYWNISFYREPMIGLGSRSDGDYYLNNGQWLLRESKNFPRFKGDPNALVCINSNCRALPADNKLAGALFMIWGKNPTPVSVAGINFEIFTDKQAEAIDKIQLMKSLEPNITYLNNVFMSKLGNYIKKPVKIVLLANASPSLKDSGGLAGDHAFLVNYYVRNGQIVASWQDSFADIALHEYVHILAPCNLFPRWACESLADYYSYKAATLGKVNLKALMYWNQAQQTDTNYKLGLYKLDQMQKQTGQWAYYKLFYIKGASFWNELDLLLHQKNDDLDNYLNLLVINPNTYQSKLPEVFVDKMISIVGEKDFNTLATYYLY